MVKVFDFISYWEFRKRPWRFSSRADSRGRCQPRYTLSGIRKLGVRCWLWDAAEDETILKTFKVIPGKVLLQLKTYINDHWRERNMPSQTCLSGILFWTVIYKRSSEKLTLLVRSRLLFDDLNSSPKTFGTLAFAAVKDKGDSFTSNAWKTCRGPMKEDILPGNTSTLATPAP